MIKEATDIFYFQALCMRDKRCGITWTYIHSYSIIAQTILWRILL